jgi:hypothetical protein
MAETGMPEPPEGLRAGGADLWRSVLARWDVDRPHELRLLLEICRMADLLDDLYVQAEDDEDDQRAAMVELRHQRIAFARMCAALRIPDEEDGSRPQRRSGVRGIYRTA